MRNFAWCSAPDDRGLFGNKVLLQRVSSEPQDVGSSHARQPHSRWVGLLNVRGEGT